MVEVETPVANTSPSLLSVTPLPTRTPALAVIIPIESTLVTSSYVKTPPIVTLPLNVPDDAMIDQTVIFGVPVSPCELVARVDVAALPVVS